MPAPVLVVHDEQNTRELAVAALRDAFLEVVGFDDPLRALDAIEARSRVRVLGYPPGLASSELVEIRPTRSMPAKPRLRPSARPQPPKRASRSRSSTPREEWIEIPVPAVIDNAQFEAVNPARRKPQA